MMLIESVEKRSPAWRAGLRPGMKLISLGGEIARDIIDYVYFNAEECVELVYERKNGKQVECIIEKDEYEDLGIGFAGGGLGAGRGCANNCVFCFVDQLPKGMRETLYFKDDDWRMSFIMGNYITLTNVSDAEFERILKRKPSPLYISVHATDGDARKALLRNERGANIMERLRRMAEAGIYFNSQIVLVPGMNDGEILKKSLNELAELYPYSRSVAIVPLGMTGHREELYPLTPVTKDMARESLDIIEAFAKDSLIKRGTRFAFASDELYIRAERELPRRDDYEDFASIEDGVGMVSLFVEDALEELKYHESSPYGEVSVVTGVDFAPYMKKVAEEAEAKLGVKINVYPVKNNHFGQSITVTGLLTAKDIISEVKGQKLGERMFLSKTMLRDRQDVFLDDVTIGEFCGIMGVECESIEADGAEFVRALSGWEE